MMAGKFLTLEGIEGVGKSTNLEYIHTLLKDAGHECLLTREPGGTNLGESLRHLLLDHSTTGMAEEAELLLMFAARAEHLNKVILPALESGKHVLCDRFTEATYAYQGGGRGIHYTKISELEQWLQGELRPDLTIILDASVDVGRARASQRSEPDRIEREKDAFFIRVRQAYLDMAKQYPQRICVIDASEPIEQVKSSIKQCLHDYHILN